MNRLPQGNDNNNKIQKKMELINKLFWLTFLQANISLEGSGWKFELKYQPIFENKIFTELVENSKQKNDFPHPK